MRSHLRLTVVTGAFVPLLLAGGVTFVVGQGQTPVRPPASATAPSRPATGGLPRTADGKPDFTGIWQVMNTANWDLQPHAARQGPVIALGAAFSVPGGAGVVEGGEIPYLPAAAAKREANGANWLALDPEIKCYLPGVPRMMYMPYPVQIVQGPRTILMASEFNGASRTILMNSDKKSPTSTWMGWSVGRWHGDALVVEVTDFNDQTWFDRAGNHHSESLKVVERYTFANRNTINYEAAISDPVVFSRSWTISMPLYRHLEKSAELMEYKCAEFVEELIYGHLRTP